MAQLTKPFWAIYYWLPGVKVTWWKEVEVCYCVVKKMELSTEYFGNNCQTLLNQFFILYLPRYSIVSLSFFRIWYRTLHSIIVVIFGLCNAFPNGEMEIFYLSECDLSDLHNMYCKVSKWHDGKKWMCATVLWRNWGLAVNMLGDITKLAELTTTKDVLLKTNDNLLKTEENSKWAQVSQTQLSTTIGH